MPYTDWKYIETAQNILDNTDVSACTAVPR